MKVAVASLGNNLEALVSPVFGRAPFFVFVEVENGEIKSFESLANPGVQAVRGAGILAAQSVVNKGAEAVVGGSFGPNAYTLLAQCGIKIYSAFGIKVGEAAIKAEKGELGPGIRRGRWGFGGRRRWF